MSFFLDTIQPSIFNFAGVTVSHLPLCSNNFWCFRIVGSSRSKKCTRGRFHFYALICFNGCPLHEKYFVIYLLVNCLSARTFSPHIIRRYNLVHLRIIFEKSSFASQGRQLPWSEEIYSGCAWCLLLQFSSIMHWLCKILIFLRGNLCLETLPKKGKRAILTNTCNRVSQLDQHRCKQYTHANVLLRNHLPSMKSSTCQKKLHEYEPNVIVVVRPRHLYKIRRSVHYIKYYLEISLPSVVQSNRQNKNWK